MPDRIDQYQTIDTKTSHMTIPEMVSAFLTTGNALNNHTFFGVEGNWPGWLEGGKHYLGYSESLRMLDDEYRAGNKTKKAELDLVRARAAFSYHLGGQYVIMRAYERKEPQILLNTYPLKSATKVSQTPDVYTAEIVLTAKNGSRGEAVLRGHHIPKGGPYQVQFCKGTAASEDLWIAMPEHHLTCSKIVVTNLDPVSLYYFRIRHNGPKGPGPWSQPVSLIIH